MLFWEGRFHGEHSFARLNRELCLALVKAHQTDLRVVPLDRPRVPDPEDPIQRLDIEAHPAATVETNSVWLRCFWPPRRVRPPGATVVALQPWEYSVLPREVAAALETADEIWATSSFTRRAFERSGLPDDRLRTLPLGVDTSVFAAEGERAEIPGARRFRILFVGATVFRKGTDVLLEAYRLAFDPGEDVTLVIKDVPATGVYRGLTAEAQVAEYRGRDDTAPIIHIRSWLDDRELASLYRSCDLFAAPYRGEGFCLPALEAMACGCPVAVTEGGATDDFCDEEVGWLIPARPRSIGYRLYGMPLDREGFVVEPDVDELSAVLSDAFAGDAARRRKADAALRRARSWTWDRAARRAADRLGQLGLEIHPR